MIELVAAGVGIIASIIFILIGIEYRNLKRRIRTLEDDDEENSSERRTLREKVNTLWVYVFGLPDDETDGGLSQEINDGFQRIESDLEEVDKKNETYHQVEMEQLRRLVNELHDEEALELERDDVLKEDD